jgi:1,4-alpha-glucan branching enzyme
MNTDSAYYGGSDVGNGGGVAVEGIAHHGFEQSMSVTLGPLACVIMAPK